MLPHADRLINCPCHENACHVVFSAICRYAPTPPHATPRATPCASDKSCRRAFRDKERRYAISFRFRCLRCSARRSHGVAASSVTRRAPAPSFPLSDEDCHAQRISHAVYDFRLPPPLILLMSTRDIADIFFCAVSAFVCHFLSFLRR